MSSFILEFTRMGAAVLILLLAPALIHAQLRPGQPCNDASGNRGTCVLLRQCQPLWDQFLSRNPTVTNFLRRSHCGFKGRDPLVCCATNRQSELGPPVPNAGGRNLGPTPRPTPKITTARPSTSRETPAKMTANSGSRLLPSECGAELVDFIVGGTAARLGEHPWLVGLEYLTTRGRYVACGGTLISSRYVLTAAHCIRSNSNERLERIVVGEHNLNTTTDCEDSTAGRVCAPPAQRIPIEKSTIHPQYSSGGDRHNDIALIRLQTNAVLSDYALPACIPSGANLGRSAAGTKQTVTGWGRTEDSWKSDIKQVVRLPVLENSKCAELYAGRGVNLAETQVCAGGLSGMDSCSGDSGGPLLEPQIRQEKVAWTLIGIVSIGPRECGTANQPGIYTRVASYVPWILDNLQP